MRVQNCIRSITGCCGGSLRLCCPCIYKLIMSPQGSHKIVKGVVGFPVGAALGLMLFNLTFSNMNISVFMRLTLGFSFMIMIAIGFSLSIQIRCMCCLIIPIFMGKEGRTMLTAAAVQYLIQGPVNNIVSNAEVFIDSVNCNNNLSFAMLNARYQLMASPVKHMMKDFKKQGKTLDKQSKKLGREFNVVENEVEDEEEMEDLKESNSKIDKIGNTESRQDKIDKIFKAKKGMSKADKKQMKYEKKSTLRCEELYSAGVMVCRRTFKTALTKCNKKMPKAIRWLVCSPFRLTFLCKLVKLITKAMGGLNCNIKEASDPGFGLAYYTAHLSNLKMKKGFNVKLKTKTITFTQKLDQKTPGEIKEDVMHAFKTKKHWVDYFMELIKTIKAFMFLRVMLGSMKYLSKYLADDEHDNKYITPYFRKIDARRWMMGKWVMFPLRKGEKKMVIDIYNTKLNKGEKTKTVKGIVRWATLSFAFFMIFLVDHIIADILDIIRTHSHVTYTQEGEHEINVKVTGDGALAQLLYSLVKNVNHTKEIDQAEDNFKCLPIATRTSTDDKVTLGLTMFAILVLTLLDAFTLRARRAICAFFYPKREKERILHLYNDMTKKRRTQLSQWRKLIRRKAKQQELEIKGTIPFFRKLGLCKRRCLVCNEKEDKQSSQCPTEGCRALYCWECWIDIEERCYACRAPDEFSDRSSDLSIQ